MEMSRKSAFQGSPAHTVAAKAARDRNRRAFLSQARGAIFHIATGGFVAGYTIWKEGI